MPPVLLFDLDDTLVVEEPAAVAAFAATAQVAADRHPGIDAGALAVGARTRARELHHAAPTFAYCDVVGISSWESLWCRFEGDDPDNRALRTSAPAFRREAWRLALADRGVHDDELAEDLGERFGDERRARHESFGDVGVLEALAATHTLALVTNGAACLQREKLAASGLADRFAVVVVSAEVGAGKPDPAPFRRALAELGADRATMIGDSLRKDVDAALAAGLDAIWVNRDRRPDRPDVKQVATLAELPALLA